MKQITTMEKKRCKACGIELGNGKNQQPEDKRDKGWCDVCANAP